MTVRLRLFVTMAVAAATLCPAFADSKPVPVDDFAMVTAWSSNKDGGQITVAQGEKLTGGSGSLRLTYPNEPVHYGNAVREVTLPMNVSAIEFDVKVLSADAGVYPFLWLWEKDGDGYNARWFFDAEHPGRTPIGWAHVRVPVTWFKYNPRGNKVKELSTLNRFMIGFGGGRADVEIAHLRWEIQDLSAVKMTQTEGFTVERGAKGSVAIMREDYPASPGNSDPNVLAQTLRAAGYGVTFVKSGDMVDPTRLSNTNFDILVFPYGPRYPFAANNAIRSFLHGGGSFLSTGGYAFDNAEGYSLPTLASLDTQQGSPLNARAVQTGDMMPVGSGQIPVFDPGNPLLDAISVRPASGQSIVTGTSPIVSGQVKGYAASAVIGDGNALKPIVWGRRIPVLMAYDRVGRERGAAGSLIFNYAGTWKGSSWGIFGSNNVDIFRKDGPLLPQLPRIVDSLIHKTYLRSLHTDLRQYERGETVNASVVLENQGSQPVTGKVTFAVVDRKGVAAGIATQDITVQPHSNSTVESAVAPTRWDDDLYTLTATFAGSGTQDSIKSGYTVAHAGKVPGELDLKWRGNYFRDGDRPMLSYGVCWTSSLMYSELEDPNQWDIDLKRMRESGLTFVRVIGVDPWYDLITRKGSTPTTPPTELPKQFYRNLDSLTTLIRHHHMVLMYDLVDHWSPIAVTPEQRAIQGQVSKLIAAHLKGVAGVVFDLSNEPMLKNNYNRSNEARKKDFVTQWNEYLRVKYGTNDALNAAWGAPTPAVTLGAVTLEGASTGWAARRSADYEDFYADLLNKWVIAVTDGVRAADPARITLTGFIQGYNETNKMRSQIGVTHASMHSYAPVAGMRTDLKLFDHRAVGQGISLTEFGDVSTHERRGFGVDTTTPDALRFVATGSTVFAQGGSLFQSWTWKDMDDIIFPWGVNYAGNGPRKTTTIAARNFIALVRANRPVYVPEQVYVVAPSEELSGSTGARAVNAINSIITDLWSRQIELGVIDHHNLDKLPASAKVLIYPAAMIMPDEAYAALRKFAAAGGTVCIAGDFSFGPDRTRTHLERLQELGGFKTTAAPGSTGDPWSGPFTADLTTAKRDAAGLMVNIIGKGKVVSTLDPTGGIAIPATCVYSSAVTALATKRYTAATAAIVNRVAEEGGGRVYYLANPTQTPLSVTISCEAVPAQVTIGIDGVALVRYDAAGAVVAIESMGPATIGKTAVPMVGHFALMSSQPGPLLAAKSLVAIPFGPGAIDLGAFKALKGATARAVDYRDGKTIDFGTGTLPKLLVDDVTAFDLRIIAPSQSQASLAAWLDNVIELRER